MKNRLQFRHHTQIFDTREEAIEYIKIQIRRAQEGLAADDPSYGYSLLAEPTVLRYKNEEDESNPHVILAIGAETNDTTFHDNNRFCFIDIDNTDKEISELSEKVADAVNAFTLNVLESNTVKFNNEITESGTNLSADVKLSEGKIFDDIRRPNSILSTNDGLFLYVNMSYDAETDTVKFIVNGDVLSVKLSNSKLASGYYDKKDESLHLVSNDGSEVVVDCEELIAEWNVEGDATRTPVVLTREEVGYSSDDGHSHIEPWQDVLRADVRLKDEQKITENGITRYVKDEGSTNILNRTTDGRYLYVDGRASSIIYYVNGEKSNVKDALDKLGNIKLSTDNDNIITNRTDGFFASATLDYVTSENTLVFRVTGQEDTRIKLNSVELFKDIHYDYTDESLVITYIDNDKNVNIERIPLGDMLRDWEWEPLNEAHNVKLTKTRIVNGNDKVSADVRIFDGNHNILEDYNHQLYVKGTADNIKYTDNYTVKSVLDDLVSGNTGGFNDLKAIIGDGFTSDPDKTITAKYNNLSTRIDAEANRAISTENGLITSVNKLLDQDILAKDNSIEVDKTTTPNKAAIKVNLSSEIEDGRKNIIKLNNDGLYANVDISYIQGENKLIFHTSGSDADKEIKLDGMSSITNIYYDNNTEEIVIEYVANGSEHRQARISARNIINEWRVSESTDGAIKLTKTLNHDDEQQDVLYAEAIINTTHGDNALVNDHGSLYVSADSVMENSTLFHCLSAETKSIEKVLGVLGACEDEILYPASEESMLSAATSYVNADEMLEKAINDLREDMDGIDIELIGVETPTVKVRSYLDENNKRNVAADVKLSEDTTNVLEVLDDNGIYLSDNWNCGEFSESDSDDIVNADEAWMNYQRMA